jgi:ATP-binding cassette subfamily C (CFTR/MRP) protein 1
MLMALLRVLRCSDGVIRIDGVDVASVSLHRLRSSVAIIPQDPVQIASTVREAVDPAGMHTEAELERILEQVLCVYFARV